MADSPPLRPLPERLIAWALRRSLVRALLRYSERKGPMLADSITYRALFSVFAGVLLGFSVAALWLGSDPVAWSSLVSAVDAAVPGLVGPGGVIDPATIRLQTGFTIAGILSLVGLFGASISAIGSLRTALRALADRGHDETFFLWVILRNLVLALVIGALLVLSAVATFLGTAFVGQVLTWLGIPEGSVFADLATRTVAVVVVFLLDTAVVALSFRMLAGLRTPAAALWTGAVLGGLGLTVLQQLSGLFVRGATSNPLLAVFASLIALLLWFNLSAQVILIASSVIVTITLDAQDPARSRQGAETFAQRRVQEAEDALSRASAELTAAQDAERAERSPRASRP